MALQIVRNDIMLMNVEAIVNPTDYCLSGCGSIDKRIHELGGIELRNECDEYKCCEFGDAILTNAYNLNCKYIIHTVGPFWRDNIDDLKILQSCYINCLNLAKEHGIKEIAFPLIATGSFGCPMDKGLNIAINTINSFLFENEMSVYLVVYSKEAYNLSSRLVDNIKEYISNDDVDERLYAKIGRTLQERKAYYEYNNIPIIPTNGTLHMSRLIIKTAKKEKSLDDLKYDKKLLNKLSCLDNSFGTKILNYIDSFGFTDVEVYKAAELSRQLFQKIKNNENPSKKTALALCVVLPLKLDQVKELLASAGYAFNTSNKFEQAIMLIIENMSDRTSLLSILKINLLLDDLGVDCF